jgi:hypothetical protein
LNDECSSQAHVVLLQQMPLHLIVLVNGIASTLGFGNMPGPHQTLVGDQHKKAPLVLGTNHLVGIQTPYLLQIRIIRIQINVNPQAIFNLPQ